MTRRSSYCPAPRVPRLSAGAASALALALFLNAGRLEKYLSWRPPPNNSRGHHSWRVPMVCEPDSPGLPTASQALAGAGGTGGEPSLSPAKSIAVQSGPMPTLFDWKRFWCPRDKSISLSDQGFLPDPDKEWGLLANPDLVQFEEVAATRCLALLGEPGVGKSLALASWRTPWDFYQFRGCSLLYFSSAAVATFSSCSSLAISSP